MQEALMLFDSICNSRWFAQTAMILFLNKQDVFTARVPVSSITSHFSDYAGTGVASILLVRSVPEPYRWRRQAIRTIRLRVRNISALASCA